MTPRMTARMTARMCGPHVRPKSNRFFKPMRQPHRDHNFPDRAFRNHNGYTSLLRSRSPFSEKSDFLRQIAAPGVSFHGIL